MSCAFYGMCAKDSTEREKNWKRYPQSSKLNVSGGQREFGERGKGVERGSREECNGSDMIPDVIKCL